MHAKEVVFYLEGHMEMPHIVQSARNQDLDTKV